MRSWRDRDDSTVSQFTVAADGVVLLDDFDLDYDQTVAAAVAIVTSGLAGAPA